MGNKFLLLISGMVCLIQCVTGDETDDSFCAAFRGNGYQIDWVLSRHLPQECLYFVVKDNYWKVYINNQKIPVLDPKPTSLPQNFNQNFTNGFTITDDENEAITGFLRFNTSGNNEYFVDWMALDDKNLDLVVREGGDPVPPSVEMSIQLPNYGVSLVMWDTNVCFLDQQRDKETNIYRRKYRCFDFPNSRAQDVTNTIEKRLRKGSLADLRHEWPVIAIGGQYAGSKDFLYVYVRNQSIHYCFTAKLFFALECKDNETVLLIDCYLVSTTTTALDTNDITGGISGDVNTIDTTGAYVKPGVRGQTSIADTINANICLLVCVILSMKPIICHLFNM